jgi:hypothetical protein
MLERLLNQAPLDVLRGARIEVSPLSDPEGFIEVLNRAYSITRFGAEFSLPNPFDADEDFQKPLEKVLRESNGQNGKAVIEGEDLDPKTLEGIARSAAASGNNADAKLRLTPRSRPVKRALSGNVVASHQEEVKTREQRIELMRRIRDQYQQVRIATERDEGE